MSELLHSLFVFLQGYCNFLAEEKLLQAVEVGQVFFFHFNLLCCLSNCVLSFSVLIYASSHWQLSYSIYKRKRKAWVGRGT